MYFSRVSFHSQWSRMCAPMTMTTTTNRMLRDFHIRSSLRSLSWLLFVTNVRTQNRVMCQIIACVNFICFVANAAHSRCAIKATDSCWCRSFFSVSPHERYKPLWSLKWSASIQLTNCISQCENDREYSLASIHWMVCSRRCRLSFEFVSWRKRISAWYNAIK